MHDDWGVFTRRTLDGNVKALPAVVARLRSVANPPRDGFIMSRGVNVRAFSEMTLLGTTLRVVA